MSPLDFPIIKELYDSEKIDLGDATANLTKLCEGNPEFEKVDFNLYRYKDYLINIQLHWQIFMQAVTLDRLKDHELTCMPKLIAFRYPENRRKGIDYDLLITKISGIEQSWPLPFVNTSINDHEVKGLSICDIPMYSRQRLYDELVGLHYFKDGCINPVTSNLRDLERAMLYIPSTETLLISQWPEVIPFANEKSREMYRTQLKSMLKL